MPAGFQVWNADGTLQFDTTNRLFRSLTLIDTAATNGSTTVSATAGVLVQQQPTDVAKVQPDVVRTGSTVSWTFPAGTRDNTRLLVMEY